MSNLKEERDYYIENGKYVFTEYYLRQRGYCCHNGCRHCPYGFKKEVMPSWWNADTTGSNSVAR